MSDDLKAKLLQHIPSSIDTFEKFKAWINSAKGNFDEPPLSPEAFEASLLAAWQQLHPEE